MTSRIAVFRESPPVGTCHARCRSSAASVDTRQVEFGIQLMSTARERLELAEDISIVIVCIIKLSKDVRECFDCYLSLFVVSLGYRRKMCYFTTSY